jgi:5-deoxy-D-glucuronate isomerase
VTDLHLPAGSTAADGFATVVTAERAGWGYSSLRVVNWLQGNVSRSKPVTTRCSCCRCRARRL